MFFATHLKTKFQAFNAMYTKFVDFFHADQNDFPTSSKALKRPCFGQIFCAVSKILKKQAEYSVFRHFLESLYQKIAFFSARAHP